MSSFTLARRTRGIAAASVAAFAAVLGGAASADPTGAAEASGEKPVVEKLLDIMLLQKSITPAQYDELLAQAQREQSAAAERAAEVAAAAETPPVSAGPESWSTKWDNGIKLERADGAYKLRFGGRIQLDGAVISETDGLNEDLKDLGGNGQGNGVEFRRARLYFEGTLHERLLFKAQYDFAGGESAFKDVYVGLKDLGPVGTVQVGQFKEPFLLDEMTSDDYITMMERPLNDAFFPDRNVGVMGLNTLADKRVSWQLGAFRDTDDFGDAFSSFNDTNWDIAGRVTGLPYWKEDGSQLVHLGFDYLHRFRGSTLSYSQRPEAHLADRFVNTGSFDASDSDVFNVELAWVQGPFSLQSEYSHALANGDDGQSNVDFWAAYGQLSYFLTGEHKVYEPDHGRFGRIKPNKNFNPGEGGWGAFEVATRFSYLDLNDRNIRGGELWDAQAGINWYLFPNARIMLNYIHANLSGRQDSYEDALGADVPINVTGRGDIVQTRFQVDF
jgi:phosphate-selective porin OprO/OprP